MKTFKDILVGCELIEKVRSKEDLINNFKKYLKDYENLKTMIKSDVMRYTNEVDSSKNTPQLEKLWKKLDNDVTFVNSLSIIRDNLTK